MMPVSPRFPFSTFYSLVEWDAIVSRSAGSRRVSRRLAEDTEKFFKAGFLENSKQLFEQDKLGGTRGFHPVQTNSPYEMRYCRALFLQIPFIHH